MSRFDRSNINVLGLKVCTVYYRGDSMHVPCLISGIPAKDKKK